MNGLLSKSARTYLGLSRYEVSKEINFSPDVLANYEKGLKILSAEATEKLVNFYAARGITFEVKIQEGHSIMSIHIRI